MAKLVKELVEKKQKLIDEIRSLDQKIVEVTNETNKVTTQIELC